MQEFRAEILRINKKGRLFFFVTAFAIVAIVILLIIFGIIPFVPQLIWIIPFVFGVSRYYLQTRKRILKQTIGELIISRDSITVFSEQYSLEGLRSVNLSIKGWKSYKRSDDRSLPVTELHAGDMNFISFVHESGAKKIEFLLASLEHWQQLREHVIHWYREGIAIKETVHGSRSYGLELLNYSQIQEFKKLIANPGNTK